MSVGGWDTCASCGCDSGLDTCALCGCDGERRTWRVPGETLHFVTCFNMHGSTGWFRSYDMAREAWNRAQRRARDATRMHALLVRLAHAHANSTHEAPIDAELWREVEKFLAVKEGAK